MKSKLVATVEERRNGAKLMKLAGTLDDSSELLGMVDRVGGGEVIINLAGVERINSTGVRDWVAWLAMLEARGVKPTLIACSPAIVRQLNLVKNFAGCAVVKSFQAPYHCAPCGRDKLFLVNVSDMRGRRTPPPCTCDDCGAAMKLADESGTYFAFVEHLADTKPATPSAVGTDPGDLAGSRPSANRLTPSSPYLSAFQVGRTPSRTNLSIEMRPSQRALPSPPARGAERPYLIAIVVLMLATVGVLLFLLQR